MIFLNRFTYFSKFRRELGGKGEYREACDFRPPSLPYLWRSLLRVTMTTTGNAREKVSNGVSDVAFVRD